MATTSTPNGSDKSCEPQELSEGSFAPPLFIHGALENDEVIRTILARTPLSLPARVVSNYWQQAEEDAENHHPDVPGEIMRCFLKDRVEPALIERRTFVAEPDDASEWRANVADSGLTEGETAVSRKRRRHSSASLWRFSPQWDSTNPVTPSVVVGCRGEETPEGNGNISVPVDEPQHAAGSSVDGVSETVPPLRRKKKRVTIGASVVCNSPSFSSSPASLTNWNSNTPDRKPPIFGIKGAHRAESKTRTASAAKSDSDNARSPPKERPFVVVGGTSETPLRRPSLSSRSTASSVSAGEVQEGLRKADHELHCIVRQRLDGKTTARTDASYLSSSVTTAEVGAADNVAVGGIRGNVLEGRVLENLSQEEFQLIDLFRQTHEGNSGELREILVECEEPPLIEEATDAAADTEHSTGGAKKSIRVAKAHVLSAADWYLVDPERMNEFWWRQDFNRNQMEGFVQSCKVWRQSGPPAVNV